MSNHSFKGRVAVVTGAASGIGEALSRALAAGGARLAISDIHGERLTRLAAELTAAGAECMARELDVADPAAVQAFADETEAAYGRVDLVFNNAGVAMISGVEAAPLADAHWLMNINFWGVVHGCRAFAPALRRAGGGHLVNVSSIFAMVSMPSQAFYNASKAAVRGFSDALREELRGTGIQVLCVHPGGVKTRIAEDARIRDLHFVATDAPTMRRRFLAAARTTPATAAETILDAVRAGDARVLVGGDAKLLDAMFRLVPSRASRWLSSLAKRQRGASSTAH
ncbi:MAG TPA: SDR family NAD(P)-dependent oxidoreductase [Burkholderiaceae bacterium]|jgi:NADP-dependent 3-hydroxy acid dehydrogenase YdfG|nr:SDR family NAD(P)-dependent oxidoreductase [Burkholderiaceae bacterium]